MRLPQLGLCRLLARLLFNERAPHKDGMFSPATTLVRRLSPNLLRALGALSGPFWGAGQAVGRTGACHVLGEHP